MTIAQKKYINCLARGHPDRTKKKTSGGCFSEVPGGALDLIRAMNTNLNN
jgi:hypothetical protein